VSFQNGLRKGEETMKVIIVQDVEKLGKFGEVKEVSDGYARNYLIPKKFVLPYSEQNLAYVENLKKDLEIKRKREKEEKLTFKMFKKLEKLEMKKNPKPYEQDLTSCKKLSDFIIINDKDFNSFYKKIDKLISVIK